MPPRLAAVAVALTPLHPETIGTGGATLIARVLERHPQDAEALTGFLSERHPLLARVHAIAAASVGAPGERPVPALYAAPRPADEGPMLQRFWRDVALLEGQFSVTWVFHEHGESHVAEAVGRSARHGIPPHADLLHHADPGTPGLVIDLAEAFRPVLLTEADLAALLEVPAAAPEQTRVRFAGSGDPAEAQALAGPLAKTVATRLSLVEAALPYMDPRGRRALQPFFAQEGGEGEVPAEHFVPRAARA